MYDASIRRLLEMYPAGASCDQLLYHLRTSGTRATAADILQSLNALSRLSWSGKNLGDAAGPTACE